MRAILMAAAALILAACTSSGSSSGPMDAETTYDGLVRIQNARFQRVWADPDVDFSRYSRYLPGGVRFEFRDVSGRPGSGQFPISDAQRERLKNEVEAVFVEELSNSQHFTRADAPGHDVLIIEGAILDIVSQVPPQGRGRESIFLDQVGAATLVIQLRDSQSHMVLARAVERRDAGRPGGFRSTTVTNWQEVRRLARRWATSLREGLDSFHRG